MGLAAGLGWAGLGWAGLGWAGLAGLGWAGLGWAGLGWAGLGGMMLPNNTLLYSRHGDMNSKLAGGDVDGDLCQADHRW